MTGVLTAIAEAWLLLKQQLQDEAQTAHQKPAKPKSTERRGSSNRHQLLSTQEAELLDTTYGDAAGPSVGRPREGALCLWLCSMHVSMRMRLHACEFHKVVTWPSDAATARRQARRAAAAPVAANKRASNRKRSVT